MERQGRAYCKPGHSGRHDGRRNPEGFHRKWEEWNELYTERCDTCNGLPEPGHHRKNFYSIFTSSSVESAMRRTALEATSDCNFSSMLPLAVTTIMPSSTARMSL